VWFITREIGFDLRLCHARFTALYKLPVVFESREQLGVAAMSASLTMEVTTGSGFSEEPARRMPAVFALPLVALLCAGTWYGAIEGAHYSAVGAVKAASLVMPSLADHRVMWAGPRPVSRWRPSIT
jgi:hypothetical protein